MGVKIKKILNQSRRDFTAVYECEHCGKEQEGNGYDDKNFHENVIPKMLCDSCEKTSPPDYRALATQYPENYII